MIPRRRAVENTSGGGYRARMADKTAQIRDLLHEAAETHHQVYRITSGEDHDWASWYADWLLNLSELPKILGGNPARSEITYILVRCDKEFTEKNPGGAWEDYYAAALLDHFSR